jgi:hypothetical protein
MISLRLREQWQIFTYLSLAISACVTCLRIFFLPHSLMYFCLAIILPIIKWNNFPFFPIFPIILLFFLGLILYSLFYGFRAFNQYKYKAFLLLGINLFTVIVLLFMQYVVVLPDFYINLKAREAVVAQLTSGQLKPNESQRIKIPAIPDHPYKVYNLTLPSHYTYLSKGIKSNGEINVLVNEKTNQPEVVVFFNSFGGIKRGNYTAFVYKAKSNSIDHQDLFGVASLDFSLWLLESKQIKDNWFWVDAFDD